MFRKVTTLFQRCSAVLCEKPSSRIVSCDNTFKQRRRWRQRERQNSNRFRLENNSFARASRFFGTFLYRHCTTTARLRRENRELMHQTFLIPRTRTGSIFAAWQPLRMSRRSWAAVTDFKTRVRRLKPEVQIQGSTKNIRHTKVEILPQKSGFLRKKETKLNANLWKVYSTELFCRRSWWFHVVLLNDLHLARKPRLRFSSARPAMPFVKQERLVLKFPNA